MTDSEILEVGLIENVSQIFGTSEPALRLLICLLAGYPLALIHRTYLYGKSAYIQHVYFILTGFAIGYFNYGWDVLHSVYGMLFTYCILLSFGPTSFAVAATFIFNMLYLLAGYYYTGTDDYDINWTMPHCVLVLRLIGFAFNMYDGKQPQESQSAENKKFALYNMPAPLEFFGFNFFPTSYLVGPQFPMTRYLNFVSGKFSEDKDNAEPPDCIKPAIQRFLYGLFYLLVYLTVGSYLTDSYLLSDEYMEHSFPLKLLLLGIWGRITLYKYISCWLITEGACTLFGLTYNGKDDRGVAQWNGLANVDLYLLEHATEFNHYIQSFNINTNHWVAQYIYKRLKFLGSRQMSQATSLLFLSVWHGFHSGYFMCFFFEFMVIYLERDLKSAVKRNENIVRILDQKYVSLLLYVLVRIYTFVFMGWCLIPFAFLTYGRYMRAYSTVNYIGAFIYLPYPILYSPVIKLLLHNKGSHEN